MFLVLFGLLCFSAPGSGQQSSIQADDGKRYICRAVPLSGDASCPVTLLPELSVGSQEEELRNTVMQLRETILLQKETISKQIGTINELTTKLSLCASTTDDRKYDKGGSWGKEKQNTMGDVPRDPSGSINGLGKTMQGLKDRLENLEVRYYQYGTTRYATGAKCVKAPFDAQNGFAGLGHIVDSQLSSSTSENR